MSEVTPQKKEGKVGCFTGMKVYLIILVAFN